MVRERERVDAIFDVVPLDEALRWTCVRRFFRGRGWSSREAAGERAAAGAAEGLQRRKSALVCSVCTAGGNADIDAGWRLGRPDLGLNLGSES